MNASAQNALLKTLENPTGDAMFFLISESPGGLLSTILSRCQTLRFHELSADDCAAVLIDRGVPAERARLLAGLAQGAVGRALALNEDEGFFALREKTLQSLESLNGNASVAAAAAMISEEKGSETAILDVMELWARDLMAVQEGGAPFEAPDEARLRQSKLNGAKLLRAVMRARQQLFSNVAWNQALETMYFEL